MAERMTVCPKCQAWIQWDGRDGHRCRETAGKKPVAATVRDCLRCGVAAEPEGLYCSGCRESRAANVRGGAFIAAVLLFACSVWAAFGWSSAGDEVDRLEASAVSAELLNIIGNAVGIEGRGVADVAHKSLDAAKSKLALCAFLTLALAAAGFFVLTRWTLFPPPGLGQQPVQRSVSPLIGVRRIEAGSRIRGGNAG